MTYEGRKLRAAHENFAHAARVRRLRAAIGNWSTPQNVLPSIGIGLWGAALALLLRSVLLPELGEDDILISLFPILLMASLIGGRWAGAACLVLGVGGEWYLYMGEPRGFRLTGHEPGILIGSAIVGMLVVAVAEMLRDTVEALRRANAQQRTLSRELEHRIRNTLALAAVLGRHSFRSDRDADAAIADFEGRLSALAAAHGAILETPLHEVHFGKLIAQTLRPFRDSPGDDAIFLHGPAIRLRPDVAVPFALALHELATNAAKYGALALSGGRISVTWWLAGDGGSTFHFRWHESGVGPVEMPARRGFGSHLVERNLALSIGGFSKMRFGPDGLILDVTALAERVCERGSGAAS